LKQEHLYHKETGCGPFRVWKLSNNPCALKRSSVLTRAVPTKRHSVQYRQRKGNENKNNRTKHAACQPLEVSDSLTTA